MLSLPALFHAGIDQSIDQVEIYSISASAWVSDIEFSPDGALMDATGVYKEGGGRPAKFWQADSGQRYDLDLNGWGWTFISMAFSTDGKILATASLDDPAMIWETVSGKLLYNLPGHEDITAAVAFNPDGSRLATASLDGKTKIWDAASGRELFTLSGHTAGITDLVFSRDGSKLYTASIDGTVRAYLMDMDELISLGKARVTCQITHEEVLRYLHLDSCPPYP